MQDHRLPPARDTALEGCLCPTCGTRGAGETCGELQDVRVTGCERACATEVVHAAREWRFDERAGPAPEWLRTSIAFASDRSQGSILGD